MAYTAVIDLAAHVLTARGPLTVDQLMVELRDRGIELDEFPEGTLEDAFDDLPAPAVLLTDQRWAWLPALLDGRTFTHRITEREVAHDLLFVTPDLNPLEPFFAADDTRLSDGTQFQSVVLPFDTAALVERGVSEDDVPDHALLLLPAGYFGGRHVRPDDLIGLSVTADGLVLEVVDEPQPEAPAELVRAMAAVLDSRQPEELAAVVWTACAGNGDLFRDLLLPLRDLLPLCGLTRHGDWVAQEGFDFAAWRTDIRRNSLMDRYDLTEDEALTVLAATALYEHVQELYDVAVEVAHDPSALDSLLDHVDIGQLSETNAEATEGRSTIKDALAYLDEPIVLVALLAQTTGYEADRAAPLGLFAETLEPLVPRNARPGLRWLRAKAHELLGEVATAEQVLLDAESLDPDWPLTLVELARYAFDRGDAERGLSMLRRADVPADDAMVVALERYQGTPRSDLGRNDLCWCGSGRKYKRCHLNSREIALEDRAMWLYEKACLYLMDEPQGALHDELTEVRARYADSDDAVWAATTDPLVADALLFEGGMFEEFLGTRGVLLPDDEQLLAQQWLLTERSVHEVTENQPGEQLTLRDLRTGDIQQVREHTASKYLRPGDLICARVAPAGDTLQIFGGLEPVALHQRDELIALLDSEPDPKELVEFLTRRFAPTVLQNTEGDPLVLCEAILSSDDSVALGNALDAVYDRTDPGEAEWVEHQTIDGMSRISATLRLDGDTLHVATNGEARHERVLSTIRELVPSIVLLSESRKPARDAREAAALAAEPDGGGGSDLDPADPDVAAVLEQFVLEYEAKWLDEPIPALGGITPRQAAADPTRRDDLIKLLDSFPAAEAPGTMSPERLRDALDLPPR